MKNLKLLVIPLISVSFLFSCGSKSIDVEEFGKRVSENYDEDILNSYVNGLLRVTGDKTEEYTVKGITEDPYSECPIFCYTSGESETHTLNYINSDILSINFIAFVEFQMAGIKEQGADTKASYFISNNTYTVETSIKKVIGSATGERFSKYVFNKDLVISHYEERVTATEEPTYELKIDFSYSKA